MTGADPGSDPQLGVLEETARWGARGKTEESESESGMAGDTSLTQNVGNVMCNNVKFDRYGRVGYAPASPGQDEG